MSNGRTGSLSEQSFSISGDKWGILLKEQEMLRKGVCSWWGWINSKEFSVTRLLGRIFEIFLKISESKTITEHLLYYVPGLYQILGIQRQPKHGSCPSEYLRLVKEEKGGGKYRGDCNTTWPMYWGRCALGAMAHKEVALHPVVDTRKNLISKHFIMQGPCVCV